MRLIDDSTKEKNRWTPFKLSLLFISPILLSVMIHLGFFYYSNFIRWRFTENTLPEPPITATVILENRTEDTLRFQQSDSLASFKAENKPLQKLPEAASQTVSQTVDIFPEPAVRETLDLIHVPAAALSHSWVNPATNGPAVYSGTETIAGSFSRHIQGLREGGLDVLFVFDATVSMARYIDQVKLKIANLAKTYKKLVPTCRIGMVAYRDHGEAFVTRTHPLTYAVASLQSFLNEIEAVGGGDREEAVEEALRVAIDDIKWNEKSKKIILLIGDAPPRPENMDSSMALITKFRSQMDGRLAALDTRIPVYSYYDTDELHRSIRGQALLRENREVMDEFKIFAELGGGECARIVEAEKVVKYMLVLVFGARWEMYLDEFMKNL